MVHHTIHLVCHTMPFVHPVLLADAPVVDPLVEALRAVRPDLRIVRAPAAATPARLGEGTAWELVVLPADALAAIREARAADPAIPIVAVAASANVATAGRVVDAGASDLFVLGDHLVERARVLCGKLGPLVRLRAAHQLRTGEGAPWALLGSAPAMVAVRAAIREVAAIPRPVLITGERGTGKELVARALHEGSRPGRPLVIVNCAAFPDALLESELFGHERGAYSGADRATTGRFEEAADGTLFLDEIGTMSLPFQQKILRVVEYGTYRRVGGGEERVHHARLVAATNVDLSERIAAGAFLPDLYDRLAFSVIRVPALRERREDVPALAAHFLARLVEELPSLRARRLDPEASAALVAWPFPGNVRELKHVVERAALRAPDELVRAEHLGLAPAAPRAGGLEEQVDAFRRQLVADALASAAGNQAEAARRLQVTYDQLRHWVRRYDLAPRRERARPPRG
jgi:DNA-binding NtrC family response regulator